jgi:hypothetical protein
MIMRKLFIIIFLFLFLTISSCNIPISNQPDFEADVSTKVAIAKTATVIQNFMMTATAINSPSGNTPNPIQPTVTSTPTQENFLDSLGMPAWRDQLNNGGGWSLNSPNTDTPNVTIKVENGALIMTRSVPYGGKNWWLNYQMIQDFYLEGIFSTEVCNSDDQYGLVFRAPTYFDGFGFYFTITCDGYFNLMRWDSNGAANLFNWEKPEAILAGSNQTNTFGIWAKVGLIRLYANGKMIKEFTDNSLNNKGHFGLFIDSRQTPGFTIKLDEMAFWNIQ